MSDVLGWAAIIVFLFACLGSALLSLPTKAPIPVTRVVQSKRRPLRKPKDRQKRYYQRKLRTIQTQHLLLLSAVLYHQYRAEQATLSYNEI